MTDLYRSAPAFAVRAADDDTGEVTLFGHFARFGEWTEINSAFEGHFMERIAPGAFKKTFSERTPKVLFQHGRDPELGDKPIAEIKTLREDADGAFYEARLFDGLPPLIADGLRSGQYGASFGFMPVKQRVEEQPERSERNPDGIREVTITEIKLREFGPVTFPAYEGATAGIRSLTDDYLIERLVRDKPDLLGALTAAMNGEIGGRSGLGFENASSTSSRTLKWTITGDATDMARAIENVTPTDEPADDATRASWEDAARRWTHLGRRWTEPGATHSNR
jgi:HK97 family phage prohead protease